MTKPFFLIMVLIKWNTEYRDKPKQAVTKDSDLFMDSFIQKDILYFANHG